MPTIHLKSVRSGLTASALRASLEPLIGCRVSRSRRGIGKGIAADKEMLTAKLWRLSHTSKMVLFVFDRVTGTLDAERRIEPGPDVAGV
jgi:hypothetical protein